MPRRRSLRIRAPFIHRSIELPDREVELPGWLARRPLERESEIEPQRSDRRRVRECDARAEFQVADGRVETVERDLSGIEKDRAAERSPDLAPELYGCLDERLAADRVVVAVSGSELA